MFQFGTIKFRRTFQNYFGQFVRIEKSHYNSCVLLHEAPTKMIQFKATRRSDMQVMKSITQNIATSCYQFKIL